jgi:hypothetical protein
VLPPLKASGDPYDLTQIWCSRSGKSLQTTGERLQAARKLATTQPRLLPCLKAFARCSAYAALRATGLSKRTATKSASGLTRIDPWLILELTEIVREGTANMDQCSLQS